MFQHCSWVWNSVLSDEICDSIISESDKLLFGEGVTGYGGDAHYDVNIRNTNVSFFEKYHWIEGICLHYATCANISAGWNFDLSYAQNVQYAKYFPDQHYTPHADDLCRINSNEMRKISVAIQLSNPSDYVGGDFFMKIDSMDSEFKTFPAFKNRGSVIAFPSIMPHGISPIVKGVRHSVVCWVMGPKFR
jgi:PKHD-type hydroxylase